MLDFSNNDYLALSQHPHVVDAAVCAARRYGVGAKASRLLAEYHPLYHCLETRIAQDKKTEAALFFSSGFQANVSVLSALLDRRVLKSQPLVFCDRLNHASIYQALISSQCEWVRYRHLDMEHLQSLLERYAQDSRPKFIVTETLFGMDGDLSPLEKIYALALAYKTFVYLDEAHATGLFGPQGYGHSTTQVWDQVPHLIMGTFSKALGGSGAYIACNQVLKDYLVNKASGFIYSTAPSPCSVAAALKAWKMVEFMAPQRAHLHDLSDEFRNMLSTQKVDIGTSTTHIIPIILENEAQVMETQKKLRAKNIYVSGIRPPTVPPGSARLRIGLRASHTKEDLYRFMEEWKKI
ncbi:8-amino-7-oxononanoate synthase 2 [Holospora curviuscula]|uniref:8-amino-7-oxononanoate synthase n=1 Tax=Holospora curviuscula TaxID=1082868 RepID=A0A2S5R9G2_9PROT|nr:8-amino-7-oxononanoate synthase 2 [Holospora curviuscula]